MGSLKHEIIFCNRFQSIRNYNKQYLAAKAQTALQGDKAPKQRMPTADTMEQYVTQAVRFGAWCREHFGCRHFEDCKDHIQAYADYLADTGKAPSTIHTYLAGVCCAWGVPMKEIRKPIRHAADAKRSRGEKKSDSRKDTQREVSPRLYDFQAVMGLRRRELLRLRQDCLVHDESGYLCVLVEKGKGGKRQLQRVPAGQESFVSSYFDGSHEYIFVKVEMRNKIDLHHLRHLAAWRAYQRYLAHLRSDENYRARLTAEVKARWQKYNRNQWDPHEVQGSYVIRGRNRRLAEAHGWPVKYDRLALMATSIFHLAHWRTGVSVSHYILATLKDLVMTADVQ